MGLIASVVHAQPRANQTVYDFDLFPFGPAVEAHGDTEIANVGQELRISTPEAMWSYAASFDLAATIERSADKLGQVDNGFTVEIELLVSRGHVGVLLVGNNVSSPVCQEYMSAEGIEPTTLMISVPPNAGANRLIFRNTAAGTRSQFALRRVKLRFVGASANAE